MIDVPLRDCNEVIVLDEAPELHGWLCIEPLLQHEFIFVDLQRRHLLGAMFESMFEVMDDEIGRFEK